VFWVGRGVEDEHEDDEEVRRLVAHVFIEPVGALRQTLYVSSRGTLGESGIAIRIRARQNANWGTNPMCTICTLCT